MTDPAVPEPFSTVPSPPWLDRFNRVRSTLVALPRAAVAAGMTAVIVAVVIVALLVRRPGAPPPIVLPRADAPAPAAGPEAGAPAQGDAVATVTVHAAGAVAKPGVYVVPGRARVADVLAAAGGTLADADVDQLNLAAKVTDAQRIYVARKGETAAPTPADAPTGGSPAGGSRPGDVSAAVGPIDLNTATVTQLDVLPGVGPATAKAIVDYRTAHGRFRSVTDLLSVRGIGPAKLDAIRPLVTVSAA